MTVSVVTGQFSFQHRIDSGGAGGGSFSLSRGMNTVTSFAYCSTASVSSIPSNFSGMIKLLYSSGVSSLGIDAHSQTIYSFVNEINLSPSDEVITTNISFGIPDSDYWIQAAGLNYCAFFRGTIASLMVQASYESGEGQGIGWKELYNDVYRSDNENAFSNWNVRARDSFKRYPEDIEYGRLDLETARDLRTYFFTTSTTQYTLFGSRWIISYHTILHAVSGTISGSSGGTVYLDVYQQNSAGGYIYLKSTTRTGNGSYSFNVYDDTTNYYVVAYESASLKGSSKLATPATDFDIDLAGGGGGGGEFYF
jgi:hypothetical protein